MIRIETDRLIIRDHIHDDLESLHNLISNDEVMYYLPEIKIKSIEESKVNLDEAISESKKENKRIKYYFVILDKKHNFIGEIGYTVQNCNFENEKIVHLGYFIHKEYWGKGITTEAVKAIIEYAFSEGNVHKIETGCLKDNVASEKIMLKCGFTREALKKDHVFHDGKWRDRVEYGLLKNEYK
jgi:ribosomal-protein-alanine N-acetyltransferase